MLLHLLKKSSDYKVSKYEFEHGMKVEFSYKEKTYIFTSMMMGIFNIYNLMASIAAADL